MQISKNIGIIGCGNIFKRHMEAITLSNCRLSAMCDIDEEKPKLYDVPFFKDYREMIRLGCFDTTVIATPNNLHYQQAIYCLKHGVDVIIEKPVSLKSDEVLEISELAKSLGRKAYAVLQVRHNPTVIALRTALKDKLFGDIKSVSLVQRWQRPESYYDKWYGNESISGGVLYEVGIHYLDIMCWLFGIPEVLSAYKFKNKGKDFFDTVYSIVQFENGASGSVEVSISAEPKNLECSLSVIGTNGYIKIGGKALDLVESAEFNNEDSKRTWEGIVTKINNSVEPNSYGTYVGSCPNHPKVYMDIISGNGLLVSETVPVIKFIENIYEKT